MAQMEMDLTAERAAACRERARSRGRLGGRPNKLTNDQLGITEAAIAAGKTYAELATTYGVARSTVYRSLQAMKTQKSEAQQGSMAKKSKWITEKIAVLKLAPCRDSEGGLPIGIGIWRFYGPQTRTHAHRKHQDGAHP